MAIKNDLRVILYGEERVKQEEAFLTSTRAKQWLLIGASCDYSTDYVFCQIYKGLEKIEGNYVCNLKTIKFRGTTEEFWQTLWCNHGGIQKLTIICSDGKIELTE